MASLMDHNEAMSPKGLLRQKVEETRDFDEHIKPFLDLFARTMLRFRSGERITEEDLDALDAYKVHLLHDHIRVRLDVGGQIFATSKSTLTSVKGTFFDAMFSGRWELTPEKDDGAYFIDRDPAGFSLVLQCLRGDRLNRNAITERQLAVFLDDARYYSLPAEIVERFLGGKLGPAGEQFSQESYGGMVVKDNGRVALYPVDERDSQEHSSMWDDMGGWVTGTNVYGGQDHVVITLHIEHAKANMAFGVVEEGWLDGGDGPDFDCRYELHNRGYTGGKASGSQSEVHFATGDTIEVDINCKDSMLTVRNTTQKQAAYMQFPADKQWRLYVDLGDEKDFVRMLDSKYVI